MNEDFVTFELAVKLKEKEFNYKCHYCYKNSIIMSHCSEPLNHNADAITYSAPTISQVLKWLREEKAISVEPCATPYNCWYYMIKCKGKIKATYMDNKYKTYEGAAIAGIEYVLDNLI